MPEPSTHPENILHTQQQTVRELAELIGRDWKNARSYYDAAEPEMDLKWLTLIKPFLREDSDFSICVDLAAGHGRNTRKLLEQPGCQRVYSVDINEGNVQFCRDRFANEPKVVCIHNDGLSLAQIPSAEITLFYCFDAMVHFDSDVVRNYLTEVARVLKPSGGRAFLHHSNYSGNPGGDVHDNPAWRNFMTAEFFQHYAAKEGLVTERQLKLDWTHDGKYIDCFSLLRCAK